MDRTINTKQLRAQLPEIVARVGRGERFTVLYRSRPAFRVVPVTDAADLPDAPVDRDPLFGAGPFGHSSDGLTSRDHDAILYGGRK